MLGTTDLHGNVFNWDYFKNAEFDNAAHDDIGIAKAADPDQGARAPGSRHQPVLTLDAGDTIQGTPLAYYYARIEPITGGAIHPMANAMNLVGYDAAALGNHEFNYGIDTLRTFESQLNFPLLGANAVDPATKRPVFPPYVIKTFKLHGAPASRSASSASPTPASRSGTRPTSRAGWSSPASSSRPRSSSPSSSGAAATWSSSARTAAPTPPRRTATRCPTPRTPPPSSPSRCPGVDAILVGHAHKEIAERFVTNATTGQQVLLCEPLYWGMRVAVMDLDVAARATAAGSSSSAHAQTLNSNTVAGDPAVARRGARRSTTPSSTYVNSPVGTSAAALSAARAVVEDVPIIDFVNFVQADAVKAGLTGADAALPVLSIAAPFNRAASFPAGPGDRARRRRALHLRQHAARREGHRRPGQGLPRVLGPLLQAGLRPRPVHDGRPGHQRGHRRPRPTARPDYNFDTVAGLDAPLTYDIDVAQPRRAHASSDLAYDGVRRRRRARSSRWRSTTTASPAAAASRTSRTAPVVYNRQNEIRQLLIDWVTANGSSTRPPSPRSTGGWSPAASRSRSADGYCW